MRFKRIRAAALCATCLAALPALAPPASADGGEAGEYIVCLSEAPDTRGSALTAVPYAEGYYVADSLADVLPLLTDGTVVRLARSETLSLLDAPDDPALDRQWYLDALGMDALWDRDCDGAGVRVAVIDSGVNFEHEEFADADLTGHNFLGSGDAPDDWGDDVGHGTLVTGILAAGRGNGVGGSGLTPRASVMALRCFSSQSGSAVSGNGQPETVISAIGWAIENHADVINMSFGSTSASLSILEPILQRAADAGILLVAAVGNSGGATLYYPAAFDCVTGVGWTTESGATRSQHNASVFAAAPGSGVYGPDKGGADAYRTDSGSSYSTPMVTALAVMAKQKDRAIGLDGFRRLLRLCARDMGDEGWDEYYGYGVVSAEAFADALEAPQPIVYECGGGRITSGDAPESYRIGRGAEAVLPESAERAGYVFGGWYLDEDCDGEPISAIPDGSVGEVTLYAKWTPSVALSEARACVGEDGEDYCAVTIRSLPAANGMAYAARYDADGRFLGCEAAALAEGETEYAVRREGAAVVRFFALSAEGAPLSMCEESPPDADVPSDHGKNQ